MKVLSIYLQEDKINKVRHYMHPNLDIMNLKDNPFDNPLPTPSQGRYKKKDDFLNYGKSAHHDSIPVDKDPDEKNK